jgi:hypothetical protein
LILKPSAYASTVAIQYPSRENMSVEAWVIGDFLRYQQLGCPLTVEAFVSDRYLDTSVFGFSRTRVGKKNPVDKVFSVDQRPLQLTLLLCLCFSALRPKIMRIVVNPAMKPLRVAFVSVILCLAGRAPASPAVALAVTGETVDLATGNQTWRFTHQKTGWALAEIRVREAAVARPDSRADSF